MSSKEEKGDIKKKVGSDNEVRKKTSMWSSLKKFSWLNNGICLLLIGSLLTGILVPWIQRRQKAIELWTQNRFENMTFDLRMMRGCITEFVYLATYTEEAYKQVERFMNTVPLTDELYEDFERDRKDLQKKYFAQGAKVKALTKTYFPKADPVLDLVRKYIWNFDLYFEELKRFMQTKYAISKPTSGGQTDSDEEKSDKLKGIIKRQIKALNDSYMAVIAKMKKKIGEAADESERLGL